MLNISRIKDLVNQGKYLQALNKYRELFEEKGLENTENLIMKSRILHSLGRIDEAIMITNKLLMVEENIDIYLLFQILLAHTYNLTSLGKPNDAYKFIQKMEKLQSNLDMNDDRNQKMHSSFYNVGGVIQYQLGKFENALNNYMNCLSIYEKLDEKLSIAATLNNIGVIYWNNGKLIKAIEFYTRALQIYDEDDNLPKKALTLNNIGLLHISIGNFDTALNFLKKAVTIHTKTKNKLDQSISLINIATIYNTKGELHKALQIYEEVLLLNRELDRTTQIAISLNNMGNIYFELEQVEKAEKVFLEALKYRELVNNQKGLALTLHNLVRLLTWRGEVDRAKIYINRFKSIYEDSTDKRVELYFMLTKAIYLTNIKKLKQKVEAQDLLYEIINHEFIDAKLTISALKYLTEILLEELKFYGQDDTLEEISNLIVNMKDIAQSENLFPLSVQIYILEYRFELIKGNIQKSLELLEDALAIAIKMGLGKLEKTILLEKERLESDIDIWNNLQQLNLPLSKKVKISFVYNYLEIQQKSILQNMRFVDEDRFNEDDVFSMLSNPIRREILKAINEQHYLFFSQIKKSWNLSSSSTKNHLKSMEHFLTQNRDKSYSLNQDGIALSNWLFGDNKSIKIVKI